jgi:hypothetical protein
MQDVGSAVEPSRPIREPGVRLQTRDVVAMERATHIHDSYHDSVQSQTNSGATSQRRRGMFGRAAAGLAHVLDAVDHVCAMRRIAIIAPVIRESVPAIM